MLTYRNTKTGTVVSVPCPVSGDWELVEEPVQENEEPEPKKEPVKKTSRKK